MVDLHEFCCIHFVHTSIFSINNKLILKYNIFFQNEIFIFIITVFVIFVFLNNQNQKNAFFVLFSFSFDFNLCIAYLSNVTQSLVLSSPFCSYSIICPGVHFKTHSLGPFVFQI